ncbi:MAG: hypothetical protein LBD96_06185 [Treponema sp.]|nr:hypothetical protein [Treponema sp.]
MFKEGRLEGYSSRPEDLNELIEKQNTGYTVFNAEGSISYDWQSVIIGLGVNAFPSRDGLYKRFPQAFPRPWVCKI